METNCNGEISSIIILLKESALRLYCTFEDTSLLYLGLHLRSLGSQRRGISSSSGKFTTDVQEMGHVASFIMGFNLIHFYYYNNFVMMLNDIEDGR